MGALFQALVNGIASGINWLGSFVSGLVVTFFSALLGVLDQLLAWLVLLVGALLNFLVDLFAAGVTALVGILPSMPEPTQAGQIPSLLQSFMAANQYVPLSEALALTAVWAVLFAGVGLYKLYKALAPWAA